MKRTSGLFRLAGLAVLGSVLCWGLQARAQDPAVLAKVTDLNKRALDAYENLDLEEARKFLMEALQACATEGLNSHPLKARTHVHLGVVLVGGLKRRDLGIAQFKRAIEIDPNIKITKRLSNPEVQAAFDEAMKGGAPTVAPASAPAAKEEPTRTAAEPEAAKPAPEAAASAPEAKAEPASNEPAPKKITGVFHEPLTECKANTTIEIKAAVEKTLPFDRVILAYRPEGASDFLARDMEKDDRGWFVARIPQPATTGNMVSYYIEARNKAGQAIATNGSAGEPHLITLASAEAVAAAEAAASNHPAVVQKSDSDEPSSHRADGAKKYWLSFGLGTGYGYAKGTPEVSPTGPKGEPLTFTGGAPATLLHFAPEVGFFYEPNIILSLQGRFQVVSGATDLYSVDCAASKNAMGEGICAAAKGAIALVAKATYLLGKPAPFRTFVTGSLGVGEIRHLTNLGNSASDCGPTQKSDCVDTISGGPVLLGPGAGFTYELSERLLFVASANALLGVPKTTLNLDVSVGLGMGL